LDFLWGLGDAINIFSIVVDNQLALEDGAPGTGDLIPDMGSIL
jgi:hypothetical protein